MVVMVLVMKVVEHLGHKAAMLLLLTEEVVVELVVTLVVMLLFLKLNLVVTQAQMHSLPLNMLLNK